MELKQHLKITSAVLCEDVRKENNNKHLIVGAYGGSILLSKMPGTIAIALYLEGVAADFSPARLSLRFSGPGEGSATLHVQYTPSEIGEKLISFGTPQVHIGVTNAGTFKIEYSEDDENWSVLLERSVSIDPRPSASELGTLS